MKHIFIISILALFISCTKKKSDFDNTLKIPLADQISTLDPAQSFDTISASVIYQSYEPLFEYQYLKRPYQVQPLLAAELPKIEDNGTKYIIKIKKNVAYQKDISLGSKIRFVKAQDFINQIKRLAWKPTNSNGWWLFDGKIVGLNSFREKVGSSFEQFKSENVEGLKAIDDHTLQITLVEPYPQMLYALTMTFTAPVPLEAIEYYENNLNQNIIGTGPYKLSRWTRNSILKMERWGVDYEGDKDTIDHPDYKYHKEFYPAQGDRLANSRNLLVDSGKKLPFIDKIEFKIMKEAQTRWLNFLKGEIDYLVLPKDNYNASLTETGELSDDLKKKKIKLQIFPSLTYWWLSFNMKDPIVGKNLKLRKAIAHAIDFNKYIEIFTNNIGQRANSIYAPGIPGYNPSNTLPYSYNIELAKKFLAEAGYPNGKGLPVIQYDTRGASTTNRQRAEFIKTELKKIGIEINIVTNNFPSFLNKARQGKLQFWFDGWAMDYPDAENILQLLITKNHSDIGPNTTFFSNKLVDKNYDKLKTLENSNQKYELMAKMEKEVVEQIPWVMLLYSRNYIVSHERLKNFRHSDIIYNHIKYLRLTK